MNNTTDSKQTEYACDLSKLTKGERELLFANSKVIFSSAGQIISLDNGYAISFQKASAEMINRISHFIAFDRLCCPFIRHALIVETNNSETRLELTGDPEVKKYIKAELEGFIPNDKEINN